MTPLSLLVCVAVVAAFLAAVATAEGADTARRPLALHPDNRHYLLFRGRPTVLITSGEHYGAVLNADFDYVRYLDELKANGLNLTRTFSGTYCETAGSFGITDNTLSPKRCLTPWARSATPGAADGGNKFDLTRFDPAYLARLKDFVGQAGQRGIVVELVLFCTLYNDELWNLSPMNAKNNVNGVGAVPRNEVLTMTHPTLQAAQEAFVRRVVAELKDFDNLYYEICNEPYWETVGSDWSDRIAEVIADAEKGFPHRHLIAQNFANGSRKIETLNPHVSILNFHYATPPTAVEVNYHHDRPVADDETGFRGPEDVHYRTEAWEFIIAGGAIYSSLDYSFTTAHPDGTFRDYKSPGGGSRALRGQLKVLKDFIDGFDFVRMKPMNAIVTAGTVTADLTGAPAQSAVTVRALGYEAKAYALYVRGGRQVDLKLRLPAGRYATEWVNTQTGAVDRRETFDHPGGDRPLASPPYAQDIALRLRAAP